MPRITSLTAQPSASSGRLLKVCPFARCSNTFFTILLNGRGTFVREILMLTLLLVSAALWVQAQAGHPGADIWLAPTGTSPTTVEGCLQSSGGHYTVTDNNGTLHDLTGSTARLSRYVGHEVEITGIPTVMTIDTTVSQAASTAEELPALRVNQAKQLPGKCGD